MKILALDDEELALSVLVDSIKKAIGSEAEEILSFDSAADAIDYLQQNTVDVVFCDYNMPRMNGIEFAKKVKIINPKTDIVFVTGFDEYAIEAVNAVSPKGYILKPVSKEKVEAVTKNLHEKLFHTGLYIQTFGMFNVFYNGTPVNFKVKKSLELLAYLIDSGGTCTRRDLTSVLYEDKEEDNAVRYFKAAVRCLIDTLAEIGMDNIIIRGFNSYSVDKSKISCDLYEFLTGNVNLFRGEYMSQYTWAEYRMADFLA